MAPAASPDPLIAAAGLEPEQSDCLMVDSDTGTATKPGVFAGGDAVTGALTVILAMGQAGKLLWESTYI